MTPSLSSRHVRSRRKDIRRTRNAFRPGMVDSLEERALLSGTFQVLSNFPTSGTGTMMLGTDGTVMMVGGGDSVSNQWSKLTPDSTGSYVNGSWTQMATIGTGRLFFGSNILPNGNMFVMGGEYSSTGGFNNTGEIYHPSTNTWTPTAPFPQTIFGDDPTQVLANGTILAGFVTGPQTYIYNPATDTWTQTGTKLHNDQSDEEAWTKLPGGNILSLDIFAPNKAQIYNPTTGAWTETSPVPVYLSGSNVGFEEGGGFLLNDGRVFFLGGNSHTAFYTPSTDTWTAGPDIPNGLACDDSPGAELPNGDILFTADMPLFNGPAHIFEFNPNTNVYTDLSSQAPAGFFNNSAFDDRMVVLPSNQILINNDSGQLMVFTPDAATATPAPAAIPQVTTITPNGNGTFHLTGTGLNGINEGASYGDDVEMASNYPIIRFTSSTGVVSFGRSFNWTSQVATGNAPVTTDFALPTGLAAGTYSLSVVANGIASPAVPFTIPTNPTDIDSIAVAASASPNPVLVGTTTNLSVLGADTLGESTLTYHWAVTAAPPGVPLPSFSVNDTNAAKADVATFFSPGDYTFVVTATNSVGRAVSSTVTVTFMHSVPSIVVAAKANPNPVIFGKTTNLSVLGGDSLGEASLKYTWVTTAQPGGSQNPTFSRNGTNAAKNTVATFRAPGVYTFTVTLTDTKGFSSSTSVNVTVNSTLSQIFVTPSLVTLPQNYIELFNASAYDQFGTVMQNQPTFSWSVAPGGAGGTIIGNGANAAYHSPATTFGIDQVIVSAAGFTSTVNVTVTQPPLITKQPTDVTVNAGQTATFTATALAYPAATVQWFVSSNGGQTFFALVGATSNTLSFTANASQNGYLYEAVYTNVAGVTKTRAATLTVLGQQTSVTSASTQWGTQGTAPLVTAADGLRLLPNGRSTDLPWLNINKLTITLSSAVTLLPSEVTVTGLTVANYGPVTIVGSGTTYTIIFGQPITQADRVTVTISGQGIATYTRRLDVLPGDINDDGQVNKIDMTDITNMFLGGNTIGIPLIFGDINGDGIVDSNDFVIVRNKQGTKLP